MYSDEGVAVIATLAFRGGGSVMFVQDRGLGIELDAECRQPRDPQA